jgi:hypothetical protein
LKRSSYRKERSQSVQTGIDTGPWITKGKQAKSAIGKAWAKFFHIEAIPDAKADNPYFVVACKETQRWDKLGCHFIYLHRSCFVFLMYYLCIFLGERVAIPTGSEIDGTYLDSNGEEIKKHFKKFKEEWPRHGITLQGCALRIVSQCCSSSGCEKNWSTFALIHTKVRNRLSYKKLYKLVYVNYNLRIRL